MWPGLASDFWPPAYAWLRASGAEPAVALLQTTGFFGWVDAVCPPQPEDQEFLRLSDFLAARLVAFGDAGFPSELAMEQLNLDGGKAERRYAGVANRDASDAFNRRWALTVLENTLESLRREYTQDGTSHVFPHLTQFLSFTGKNESRYAAAAQAAGLSVSALHVAVFRFRQRYRAKLRVKIADTVSAEEEVDSELTRLLVAAS